MTLILPDAEALLVAALRARSSVASLCGGRVGTRLSGVYPAVRVTLIGGASRAVVNTGRPELQVECWGNGPDGVAEVQASDLARAVEAALPTLVGVYGPGVIAGAATSGGVLHSPDGSTGRERYIVQASLVTQPVPV